MNMSCSSNLKGSVMMSGRSSVTADEFPAGLRVLVVDDDPTCLVILERMLKACRYRVTKCNRAEVALVTLRENKNGYDVVISDVHMPDMDGFKLLEHVGLEMDLPVIMMSADDSKDVVMKGVTHGACDYLIKPVRLEALKNIWQHVIRKKQSGWKDLEQSGSVEEGDRQQKPCDEADYSSSANEGSWRNSKKKREEDDEPEDRDDSSTLKKPRVVWSVELHQQFVAAVNQLGIDKAVPKKILELMNVPGLTRENVASHLQKYRLYLRRLSGVSQHQSNVNNAFISHQDTAFGPLSSLNGIDLQSLAATGQLAALQAAGFGRSTVKPNIPMPLGDQRNIFSFENPRFRSGEGQQQNLSSKQMNLLHGIPTGMEPKQFANMHQSAHSLGNMNMQASGHGGQSSSLLMPMANSQPRMPILNQTNSNHIPQAPTSVGQPIASNCVADGTLARNAIGDGGRRVGYNPVSQPSPVMNYPMNPNTELPVNNFPLGSTPGLPNFASKGSFQDEVNMGTKRSGGFTPSYDIFSDLQQHGSNEWELQNVGINYSASQQVNSIPANLDASQLDFVTQGFSSGQSSVQNRNTTAVGKAMYSLGEGIEQGNAKGFGQSYNNLLDNPVQVKTETVSSASYQTTHIPETFGQDDLMSILLKQQQGNSSQTGNEYDFDGFSIDNIRV